MIEASLTCWASRWFSGKETKLFVINIRTLVCYETLRSSSIINRRELILIIKTTTKKESTLGEQEKKNLKTKIQKSPETLKSGDNNLLKQWQAN